MFPIVDVQERVVGFGGRLVPGIPLYGTPPKYLNSPESAVFSKSRILYGLNRARKAIPQAESVLVVEGYLDVIAAHQAGIENVVATLGTALTEYHVTVLKRYTKNVVLSFDADEAGVNAALRAAALFPPEFTLKVLVLPPGEDPDSLLMKGAIPAFRRAMNEALTVPEFRLKGLEAKYDLGNDRGRIAFLKDAVDVLVEVPSALEQDLLIRRLAGYHPAGGERAEASIRAEIERRTERKREPAQPAYREPARREQGRPVQRPASTAGARRPLRTAVDQAERTLMRALLTTEWHGWVEERLATNTFLDDERDRQIRMALQPLVAGHIAPEQAGEAISDPVLAERIAELTQATGAPLSAEVLTDCLERLQLRQIEIQNREIQKKVEQTEGNSLTDDQLHEYLANQRRRRS
jgi:DNA primase